MNTSAAVNTTSDLPPVPATVITKDRQVVDTGLDVWRFRVSNDGGKLVELVWGLLDFDVRPFSIDGRIKHIYKLYLARKLQFSKGHTIRNDFGMLRRFLRWIAANQLVDVPDFSWSLLTSAIFRQFLDHGLTTGQKGNDFARLRDFYAWGAFVAELPDFDRHLALGIKALRAKGNVKGAAVRFNHPTKGPLNADERGVVIQAVRDGVGAADDRAVVMIHLELGPNPQSVARLKNRDLHKYEINAVVEGKSRALRRYQLALPRVKKRTEHRETIVRPISSELGTLLESLRTDDPDEFLFHWLDPRDPERDIGLAMRRFVTAGQLVSPRTGEALWLAPRRFRHTLATEMAREGASPEKIAAALDHTDLQNVDSYIEASSYIVEQVGDGFDHLFAPIVRRFKGVVVAGPNGIPTGGKAIPATSPHLPLLNIGGIGMCGRDVRKDGLCNLAPPLTCYACEFFAAFRNGPHEEVLQSLQNIQAELKTSSDIRIPLQLDEVVAAARQLVEQIRSDATTGQV
jgi:integrase